jgi:hypothetical protein
VLRDGIRAPSEAADRKASVNAGCSVAPTDAKASIDTMAQLIRVNACGLIAVE